MKRSRINRRSKRAATVAPIRARFVKEQLAARPWCEADVWIRSIDPYWSGCLSRSDQIHEPLTRARGGSITDPANSVALCGPCHRWVHAYPESALRVGLLRRSIFDDGDDDAG